MHCMGKVILTSFSFPVIKFENSSFVRSIEILLNHTLFNEIRIDIVRTVGCDYQMFPPKQNVNNSKELAFI